MFRAEILWLANGPTLKLEGKLAADWAEQARFLVTKDVLPEGLIVDLTEVSYIDSAGEQLLNWLASVGASVVGGNVYAIGVCDRLGLSPMPRMPARRHGNKETNSHLCIPMQVDACPEQHRNKEE
jgi:ABC-type transporter Mla MlaB component